MIFERLKTGAKVSDNDFDVIYTPQIRAVSKIHFTPVDVAKTAAQFLAEKPGAKVLDVGSGAGKFCMIGAVCCPGGFFTGVEQRESLYQLSEELLTCHQLSNVKFIHSNIMEIEFRAFDAIYFFNAFYENIFRKKPIDHSVKLDRALYAIYAQYMREQLSRMSIGTRLATYFILQDEIPDNYEIQYTDFDQRLKFWEKTR